MRERKKVRRVITFSAHTMRSRDKETTRDGGRFILAIVSPDLDRTIKRYENKEIVFVSFLSSRSRYPGNC